MRLATATSWSTWTIYWYLETRLRLTPSSRPSRSSRFYIKHIGYLEPGKPQQFLGRNIDHFGNYCNLGLKDSYIDNMIEESGMTNCNTVTTPGIAHYRPTIEDEAQKVQKDCWQTSMVSIHTTRHRIRYKRTSTRPHSTHRTFTKESQTFTTLFARHQTIQIHHRTNNNTQSKHQQHPGSRRSCRCWRGSMPYYREINFRFQHQQLHLAAGHKIQ